MEFKETSSKGFSTYKREMGILQIFLDFFGFLFFFVEKKSQIKISSFVNWQEFRAWGTFVACVCVSVCKIWLKDQEKENDN